MALLTDQEDEAMREVLTCGCAPCVIIRRLVRDGRFRKNLEQVHIAPRGAAAAVEAMFAGVEPPPRN